MIIIEIVGGIKIILTVEVEFIFRERGCKINRK